MDSLS